jgi:flavin reductase (DIM6/NTAB) family NADH-FMN oxidoreductase RutF
VLRDTLASLDCALDQIINIGTHSLFVGHVVAVRIGEVRNPLIPTCAVADSRGIPKSAKV